MPVNDAGAGGKGVGLKVVNFCGSKAFPNSLQGSKYGGCCMNELGLGNIKCVEPFRKMLSKYSVPIKDNATALYL